MKILIRYSLILITTINSFGQVPQDSLKVYYPFNNNANDASGNNHNGIVKGATLTTDRFNNPNSAYRFDNDTIVTNYMGIGADSARTICFWFYTESSGSTVDSKYLVGYGGSGIAKRFDCSLFPNNVGLDISSSYAFYTSNIIPNQWYFYAVTYSKSDGKTVLSPKVYLDGLLKTNISTSSNNTITLATGNAKPLTFGSNGNPNNDFKGKLDDIRIYNRVLTPNEITSLYNENFCFKTISVTDTLRISSLTGYNDIPLEFGTIKVYPNPSNSNITLDASNTTGNYNIKITNSLSQTVYSAIINKQKTIIDFSSLGSQGVYYLLIQDNSNKVLETKKLILE